MLEITSETKHHWNPPPSPTAPGAGLGGTWVSHQISNPTNRINKALLMIGASLADWRLAASKQIPKCWATLHRNTEWKSGIQRGQGEKATIKRNREKRLKSPERTSKFDVLMLASWLFLTPKSAARLSERLPIVVKLRVSWASEPTVGEAFKLQTSKNSVLYVTSQGCYVVGGWVGGAISERSTGSFALKRLAEVA